MSENFPPTLYFVAPTNDQCEWDEDGPVSDDLFVWARDASEAVRLWREYYGKDDAESGVGIVDPVRVYEVPIMPANAPPVVVGWDQIHTYGATVSERSEI